MLQFTGERLVPGAANCEPTFAAKMYHEHAARYLFAAQIVRGKRVLDIGCGVGYGSALLADAGAAEVVAFDIAPQAVDHARAHFGRASIRYEVASALDFDFGEFDVVTCFELIEHVNEQSALLQRIARAVGSLGSAFISTPRPQGDAPRSAFHVHELTFDDFRELLAGHFTDSAFFFEANQFGSRVDAEGSSAGAEVRLLEPGQFQAQAADYFLAVVGNGARIDSLQPIHVLGDDSYVLTLENDVRVLRDSQQPLQDVVSAYEEKLQNMRRELAWSERARNQARALEAHAHREVAAMKETVSWRVTSPLRAARRVTSEAARLSTRAGEIHRMQGTRALLAAGSRRLRPTQEPAGRFRSEVQLSDLAAIAERESRGVDVCFLIGCWDGQSKRYRVSNVAAGLRELGYSVLVLDEADASLIVEYNVAPRILVVFRAPLDGRRDEQLAVFRHVREAGGRVVVDFDDLVFEPEVVDEIGGFHELPERDREDYVEGVRAYRRMLEQADVVTCPTPFLAARVADLGVRSAVVRNSLDSAQLGLAEDLGHENGRSPTEVTIAYASGTKTHQADFARAAAAVERILDERPETRFTLVGHLDLPSSWSRFGSRVTKLELMPYLDLLRATRQFDVNIAPLVVGNDFCEAKSELKIFEAGVVGVPTVASATGTYTRAIDDGVDGFLAGSPDEWYEKLTKLVESPGLRSAMGAAARSRALEHYTYRMAAAEFVEAFGLEVAKPSDAVRESNGLSVAWIVPGLLIGGGGHRNIFRAAYHLERLGYDVRLYFTDWHDSEDELNRLIHGHFYPLQGRAVRYEGSVEQCDVLFATHWSTVKPVLDNRGSAGHVMYFVQDFEPLFYPMSSEYLLAENTYRAGLYHITSGPWCERVLRTRFGVEADHFQFPVDTDVYFPRERTHARPRVLYFAKPEMPRRCYSLGVEALREFHRLRPDVEIVFFGSDSVDTAALGFPTRLAGLLDLEGLAELYSNSDLGIVFSPTNPSLVPYEMMACALPVVDLKGEFSELNYGGRNDIALLVEPDPLVIAARMADLLADRLELSERSRLGLELAATFPTEEETAARISDLIQARVGSSSSKPVAGAVSRR